MKQKTRVWIKPQQMELLKELLAVNLGNRKKAHVPFTPVIGILGAGAVKDSEKVALRLVWSRTARETTASWGLKIGVRNRRKIYVVQVLDQSKWEKAISGISSLQDDSVLENEVESPSTELSDDPLVPVPDPLYSFPAFSDDLKKSIQANERVLLVGPCGSGKSSLVRELAARAKARFMRINLNGETSVADLIGQWRIIGKEMIFNEGPVPKAMKSGAVLCCDELDSATAPVLFCLQALIEENGKLFIGETGEWIAPHKDFRLVATANTKGKGDDSGLYNGTNVLNESFLDRFASVFEVDYLPASEELKLIMAKVKGLNRQVADRMIRCANDLRKALKDGVIFSTFSTRKLIAWGKKLTQLNDAKRATAYVVLNRLSDDDRRVVAEVLQRHGF